MDVEKTDTAKEIKVVSQSTLPELSFVKIAMAHATKPERLSAKMITKNLIELLFILVERQY